MDGTPATGAHRMVGVPIPNKIPWRAVSLTPLEKSCKRETHVTVRAPVQARSVPAHPWKMFMDAWRGQCSALARTEDKHSPTFAMEWGQHGYTVKDTVRVTVRDTVRITVRDTVRVTVGNTVRDTVRETVRDTTRDTVRHTNRDLEAWGWPEYDYQTL